MWLLKIEKYLKKSNVLGDVDDIVQARSDLLPLDFYPDGAILFIQDEKSSFVVKSRKREIFVPDN